ncbi:isocitrate/isopropylmalate dehydrogenase family protein [Amycolatopsis sp. H6(2020)]|nr:isocitrate/isopropylmalate dehydrogenase family protein [Amycolatopsis sp. H6(2020)]
MRSHKIALIKGDGIGPELVSAAVDVLAAAVDDAYTLDYLEVDAGAGTFRRTGTACSPENVELMRSGVDATLKGPVGLPEVRNPDGTEAGVLGGILRTGLDLYANVRPIVQLPGITSALAGRRPGEIDYVIVRENTEGLYASRGNGVGDNRAMSDTLLTTREGTLRICRYAFELARTRGRMRKVTCADKSNVLRSYALFRSIFQEVANEFPDIDTELLYADAAAQALVLRPDEFDVLVMENFLGDILSDLGGATVGGISVCPSGNIGEQAAYFEPIHGSAPAIAGRGLANPIGQILAAALMLEHLEHRNDAARIRRAVSATLAGEHVKINPQGAVEGGTTVVVDAIIALLELDA